MFSPFSLSVQSNLDFYKLLAVRLHTSTNRSSGYYKYYLFWTLLDSNVVIKNVFDIKQCGWTDLELAVESLLFCKPLRRYRWIRNWIYPNLFDHRNCPNFRFQSFAFFFPQQIYQLLQESTNGLVRPRSCRPDKWIPWLKVSLAFSNWKKVSSRHLNEFLLNNDIIWPRMTSQDFIHLRYSQMFIFEFILIVIRLIVCASLELMFGKIDEFTLKISEIFSD